MIEQMAIAINHGVFAVPIKKMVRPPSQPHQPANTHLPGCLQVEECQSGDFTMVLQAA